jgi:alpha-N-arabinofuranosidase
MRAVDPSIKLIAVGDNNMDWNRTVLRVAGDGIDYLAIHHYYGRGQISGDVMNLMARPLFFERFYGEVEQLIRETGRPIKLAINEWGLDLPIEQQYSIQSALYGARLMNVFERRGDLVEMSAVSDLVNGWPGGIIQANRHGLFVSPIFLVNQLYNEHRGAERLSATMSGPTFDSSKEGKNVPYLDVVATRDAGKKIFIKAVNTNPTSAMTTTIRFLGATAGERADVKTVSAPSFDSFNSFARPDAISISTSTVAVGKELVVTLPKHSVSVIVVAMR